MAEVSACDVLCEAKALIEKEGWIRGAEHNAGGYCLKGACQAVVAKRAKGPDELNLLGEIVLMHLAAAINPKVVANPTAAGWAIVTGYNDAKPRTKEEILHVLDEAGACDAD